MEYNAIRDDYGDVAAYIYDKKQPQKQPSSPPDFSPTNERIGVTYKSDDDPLVKAYKAREANNKAIVEEMKVNKEKRLREGYTEEQLSNIDDKLRDMKRFNKSVANQHENVIDIVKHLKKGTMGAAEQLKYAEMLHNAEKGGLIKRTKTPEGDEAIIDINGKLTKLEDLEDGFFASMGYLLLDNKAAIATTLGATIPLGRVISNAAKAAMVSKPGQYVLQLAGFAGADSIGGMIDDKLMQQKRDAYLKNPVYKELMETQPKQQKFDDSFEGVVAVFNKNREAVVEDYNKLNKHIENLGSIQSMLDAGGNRIVDNLLLGPIVDGMLSGGKAAVKEAAPYVKGGAKWAAKQAPSAAGGATVGGVVTAGLTAVGVPPPAAVVLGGGAGWITRNKLKAGQDFTASAIHKAKDIGVEQLKNKGMQDIFNNAREQVGNVLNKKNTDPAYSVNGYLTQYYGEMFADPSLLPTLANKLGSFGIKLDLNNTTDKALAVMLMSPHAPQFVKTMANDNPAAGVAIRDMLSAFSKAFDSQIKNMLPINNKQMSVATFANDLKTMQANNIQALNELVQYGNKLTNNKQVTGGFATDYREAIRNYGDGKQLVNSGLPSKLSNRKKNIAAHGEENQNLYTRFATLNDTEAKVVAEKGLLKGATFGDLVTMRANMAVIDDEIILNAPSIANLRIAIDQGIEELLSNVSDSAAREGLRTQMQQTVNKIYAFEKLGNNKLLKAIMRENNPDAILKHFTDMMQEVQIIDNASAIKQVMAIMPTQKRAQLETLIINRIIEDVTDNLDTPGKLVINSAKLRGFISKVEGQFTTAEGKALLSMLKDYAEVFGDAAALMKAATTKSSKTGPSGGIGHNLFNKFRVYMAGKLFRNLIGYLGPGHSSSTFRLSNILAKRLRDPLDPNIGKAVDNLYNARLAIYKNAKTPEAAAAAKADMDMIKEANTLAGEVNAMSQKINTNATAIQEMEASLRAQGVDGQQAENIIGEQLGIPSTPKVETSPMQTIPISDMKNLVNLNVNKLLQMEPELVKAMENDLYSRITSEAIEVAENLAVNNKQFNIQDFINTIIYRYNQVLPNNMQKYSLQEISEQDLKPILDNTLARREEARKAYEAEKAAAYEAEQAELAAKQEAEAIANQEKEAAEEAARQQRANAEEEAIAKREKENAEAKELAAKEKEKKAEAAKEKAKEKRQAKKEAAKAMEEKLAKAEEKAANEAEKQVAKEANAEIAKLQEEGVKLAEQVTKETNDKIAKGETEQEFKQALGVKFGFVKDGKTFKQSVSIDKMTAWQERDKLAMMANDEYFAKNLDIKSVAENVKKILNDAKVPADEKTNVRQFLRDLNDILPIEKYKELNELVTGKAMGASEKKKFSLTPGAKFFNDNVGEAIAYTYSKINTDSTNRRQLALLAHDLGIKLDMNYIKSLTQKEIEYYLQNADKYPAYTKQFLDNKLKEISESIKFTEADIIESLKNVDNLYAFLEQLTYYTTVADIKYGRAATAKYFNTKIAQARKYNMLADYANNILSEYLIGWDKDGKLLQSIFFKDATTAAQINSLFAEQVINKQLQNAIERRVKVSELEDLYIKATPIERVYIARNIHNNIIKEAMDKGVNLSKVKKDIKGQPIIMYRGLNGAYEEFTAADKMFRVTSRPKKLKLGDNVEAEHSGVEDFIYRNSIFTTRDITHALHFTGDNPLYELGYYLLREDTALLNVNPGKVPLGSDSIYPRELYNVEYSNAVHSNRDVNIRHQLVKQDGVILSDDTVVMFNPTKLIYPPEYTKRLDENVIPAGKLMFNSHGGAVGAIAGLEQNEDGSYGFNIERALLGMAVGYGIHQTAPKLQAAASNLMKNERFTDLIKTMMLLPNDKNKPSAALMKAAAEPTKIMRDQLVKTNIAFMVGGEKAAITPSGLNKAKKLKEQGASDVDVYRETGWRFNNAQDKWKFDFDEEAKWIDEEHVQKLYKKLMTKEKIANIDLGDLIPNAEVLKYYPTLKNTVVVTGPEETLLKAYSDLEDSLGLYIRAANSMDGRARIIIPISELKPSKVTLQHEVQHNIQEIEKYIGLEDYKIASFADLLSYIKQGNTDDVFNDITHQLAIRIPSRLRNMILDAKLKDKKEWLDRFNITEVPAPRVFNIGVRPYMIGIGEEVIKTKEDLRDILLAAAIYQKVPTEIITYYLKLIEQEARYVELNTRLSRAKSNNKVNPIDTGKAANDLAGEIVRY